MLFSHFQGWGLTCQVTIEAASELDVVLKGATMYGNGAGLARDSDAVGLQAKQMGVTNAATIGIHPQLSDLAKRIAASVSQADKMLDRVRGPQPSQTEADSGKDASEPTTQQWVKRCHGAMNRLESQLLELQETIS